jgi:AcrR family transcriptional regulator
MPSKSDVKEERRKQIIEAATNVFARLGFHKARMDDIVEESGLSKGALYWYFKSKDEIIIAILDRMFSRDLAHVHELQEAELPVKEKLQLYVGHTTDLISSMQPLMPILLEFWGLLLRQKKVKQVLGKFYRSYMEILIPIIEEGIERGEFRPMDVESAAIAMGAIFEGTIVLWAAAPEMVDLKKHIEAGVRLVIEGMEA